MKIATTNIPARHPELDAAIGLLRTGKLTEAKSMVEGFRKRNPMDFTGMHVLADIGIKLGRFDEAAQLLGRCLQQAPDFHQLREKYAIVLLQQNEAEQALVETEKLLSHEPDNPGFVTMKGTILARIGDHAGAIDTYERVLKDHPNLVRAQFNYGHSLKTVGRLDEAIQAYRKCIEVGEGIGSGYWNLANLKTYTFSDADIALMRSSISSPEVGLKDRAHLAFALGKALEDCQEFDESFHFYNIGNATWRRGHPHNPRANEFNISRKIKLLDRDFFAARENFGSTRSDPIFILGLPRTGSTLLEQVLASHSQVQGTGELPDIMMMARNLGKKSGQSPEMKYLDALARLTPEQCRELGEDYLRTTQSWRNGPACFVDKMPNNFQHIELIHMILPNAKIIDVRRHPMACGFSCFKQLFASGQTFSYDLKDIGRYYRAYVILMDHWERVLPGRVLRVQYEDMVADTENQVRRVLDYCGLEFEASCLRFYETKRDVLTPSAEQVRQPVYTQGLEQWRNYEAHLGPLKEALGTVLDRAGL